MDGKRASRPKRQCLTPFVVFLSVLKRNICYYIYNELVMVIMLYVRTNTASYCTCAGDIAMRQYKLLTSDVIMPYIIFKRMQIADKISIIIMIARPCLQAVYENEIAESLLKFF